MCLQMITSLSLAIDRINFVWGEEPIWPFNEHKNLSHYDNKQVIPMSSKIYEKSGYNFSSDLLTILYLLSEKSNHLRPI